MALLTNSELVEMGFGSLGKNILLSNKASFYNTKNIEIGDNVRVDDFCLISQELLASEAVLDVKQLINS